MVERDRAHQLLDDYLENVRLQVTALEAMRQMDIGFHRFDGPRYVQAARQYRDASIANGIVLASLLTVMGVTT